MPRVAVISGNSPDYLIDIVTDGLVRLLGRGHVQLDYSIGGWQWDTRVTHLFQGFEGFNTFAATVADCLIASARVPSATIDKWKAATGKSNVAIIDGEDDDRIREELLDTAHTYFKREYFDDRQYPARVRPLPFAAVVEPRTENPQRSRPVFFRASTTDPWRAAVADEIRALGFEVHAEPMPKAMYNALLETSTVCPSVRGAGWDTYRYWEIPFFGSVLLSQRMPIAIADNFVEGEEALFFDSVPEFSAKLTWLLEHPDEAERIARAGQKKCMERHLSVHRAATVLEAIL